MVYRWLRILMASAALGALLGVFQISCCLGFFSLLHRESVCAVALWYAGSGVKQSTPQSALLTPKHAAHSCSTVCQHGARAVQQSVSRLSSTGCSTLQSITVQKTNLHKTSMQLDARPLFKFPTSNLGHLKSVQLSLCYLKAVPAPSAEGSITDLGVSTTAEEAAAHLQPSSPFTSLRKLELSDVMPNSNSCFVASWTTLHSLHLDSRRVEHVTESDAAAKEIPFTSQMDTITFPPQMAAVLPHLTQLRQLTLKYDSMWRCKDVEAASFAACLGSLHQLQDLRLHIDGLNCQHIAQLPTSLTGLEMQEPMDLCPETTPRLTELTQLQHLQLFAAHSFSPALLAHWTQLTWLSITCSLQRCSHSAMYRMSNDLTEFEDLMVALQQLTGLQHLNLSRSLKRKLPAGSTGLYSALTASNQLTELLYIGCFISDGAFQHVFRGVSACEALAVVAAPADVFCNPGTFKRDSMLKHLTALTKLEFKDIRLHDKLLQDIAACTGLQDLRLDIRPQLPVTAADGLMHLTQLTGLTYIKLMAMIHDYEDEYHHFKYQATPGSTPDVYLRLQRGLQEASPS